ncbi:MAG: S46 family peptidase [Planctomycetota bacterium]|nr:S46 family peptidase [Planctomycetota bacterium]
MGIASNTVRRVMMGVLMGVFAGVVPASHADEGMWLLSNPPLERLKRDHGFAPSSDWLLRMQRASVDTGASGSFVSPRGLVMTNHHVASSWIHQLSTAERDLTRDGFLARTLADELPIPGAEVSVLWETQDVTDAMKKATAGKSGPDAAAAIRAAISELEKSEQARTGMQCRVTTLYGGGKYELYRFRRYTDVRLVFAPELAAASFGGDVDNFEFPRFSLDCAFIRVYENGAPVQVEHFLPWSATGAQENELIFVFGHPGSTERLLTMDDLASERDVRLPARLRSLWRLEEKLEAFSSRTAENARVAGDLLHGVANGRKAFTGELGGLHDPELMRAKWDDEAKLRQAIERDPALASHVGDSFERLAAALQEEAATFEDDAIIQRAFRGSRLFQAARTLVQLGAEWPKPSAERLSEYRESALPEVIAILEAHAPVYPEFEKMILAQGLSHLAEHFGGGRPEVLELLGGKSPVERARELVDASTLADAAYRKKLLAAGPEGLRELLESSADEPLLSLVRSLDPKLREIRARTEGGIDAVKRDVYARLADARFAAFGTTQYPDATGTLRLSYGTIKAYQQDDQQIPAFTTYRGLFERDAARDDEGFTLPKPWNDAKSKLNLDTPLNFVCTADIIGGNSGSPVVNTKGEVIGLIFDGNIHSLSWAHRYSDEKARAIAVDTRAIVEALRVVYKADSLVAELTGVK